LQVWQRCGAVGLAKEVVLPAFLSDLKRSFADSTYFFHGVKLLDLGTTNSPELAVAGRFVKTTKVFRDQIYQSGRIVKDHKELESAPTSFFVLLLSNHKLLYIRENSGSPFLSTFAATIENFLKKMHKEWIDSVYEAKAKTKEKVTKAKLHAEWPSPTLDIVELSTETEIKKFVKKFKVINTVEIQLVNTNHEIDNSGLFRDLRSVKDNIDADRLTVKTEKAGDTGLNKSQVTRFISPPAEDANSRITIKGIDLCGEKMDAKNDHFKVAIPVKKLPSDVPTATERLVEAMKRHIEAGIVSIKAANDDAIEKLNSLKAELGL
jgi:hypothetical protein